MPPACVQIPTGDKNPPAAKIFSYPVAEAWGLIWAFNGETPLFAVPRIPRIAQHDLDSQYACAASARCCPGSAPATASISSTCAYR